MTLAELKIKMDKERAERASRPFVPPPPLPEMTPKQKESARENLRLRLEHDGRYRQVLREQNDAGAEGEGSGTDVAREARRLEMRSVLASAIAAAREKFPGLPVRSASAEEAREYPYAPGWYDPVSDEVIVNDAVAEKIALVIADMTGTDAASKWVAAFMDEERIHAFSDRAERRIG